MMKSPRFSFISTAVLAFLVSLSAFGQDRREACSFHSYEFHEIADTPAPEGYKPFYISHYGRHGSRYLTPSTAKDAYKVMKEAGELTEHGEALMEAVTAVYKMQKGHEGLLSEKGAREHRILAGRMYSRFSEVFESQRSVIRARASSFKRCRQSMDNFTASLQERAEGLLLDKKSGLKYFRLFSRLPYKGRKETRARTQLLDSMFRSDFSPGRMADEYFLKTPSDPWTLCREIFVYAASCQCLESEIDLYSFFTDEEVKALYTDMNAGIYSRFFACWEFGGKVLSSARPLLKRILDDADKALKGDSAVAADLRFGHDSGLVPLACLMGLEGFVPAMSVEEGRKACPSWDRVPMASNIQIIFYRGPEAAPILVKFLVNEREANIPALSPLSGPYYNWDDVRRHFLERL